MTQNREKNPTRLQGLILLALATIMLFAAILGSLYTLEANHQLPEIKRQIAYKVATGDSQYYDAGLLDQLTDAASVYAHSSAKDLDAKDLLDVKTNVEAITKEYIAFSPGILSLAIENDQQVTLLSAKEESRSDKATFSGWLIERPCEYEYSKLFLSSSSGKSRTGSITITFVALDDDPGISQLKTYYHFVALSLAIVYLLVYYIFVRLGIIPLLFPRSLTRQQDRGEEVKGEEQMLIRPAFPIRARGYSLLALASALYLLSVAGSLYTTETGYYIPAKSAMISEWLRQGQYLDFPKATEATDILNIYARRISAGEPASKLESLKKTGEDRIEAFMDSTPHVVRVQFVDSKENVIVDLSRPERLRENNDWSNSLVIKDFERVTQQPFRNDRTQEVLAVFRVFYTTEKGNPEIEVLTRKYRWIMISLILFYTSVYLYLMFMVLIPLSRITTCMQYRRSGGIPIISSARSQVEKSYNNLARDASLTRVSKELREYISKEGLSHLEPILEKVPEMLERLLGMKGCQVWLYSRSNSEQPWHFDRVIRHLVNPFNEEEFEQVLGQAMATSDPFANEDQWICTLREFQTEAVGSTGCYVDLLVCSEERVFVFVVQCGLWRMGTSQWWVDFYSRVAQELRYAISSVEEQRRMILQEKSKANISLSRNLGHDLTNIIATSKLDLMTIRVFLSLKPEDVINSPQKEAIFKEALEALLNNTKFLQEVVNLYRSFSYLQKPKFEEVDVCALISEVVLLYELSNSRNIRIETSLLDSLPDIRLEPRLFKLALFNMLTNAADAIKRATSKETPEGSIQIDSAWSTSRDRIEITVADTGTGICDSDGQLLAPDALAKIFRVGYSTKANQEGEGLGLNWVQTIIREFHGGELIAANRPSGGAAFTIRLPLKAISHDKLPLEEAFSQKSSPEIKIPEERGPLT